MEHLQKVCDAFKAWEEHRGSVLDLMEEDGTIAIPGIAPHCGTYSKSDFVSLVAAPFMNRFAEPPIPPLENTSLS